LNPLAKETNFFDISHALTDFFVQRGEFFVFGASEIAELNRPKGSFFDLKKKKIDFS